MVGPRLVSICVPCLRYGARVFPLLSRKQLSSLVALCCLFLALAPSARIGAQPGRSETRSAAGLVSSVQAQSQTFVFAAGGDIGANRRSDASLRAIPTSGAAFFLAVGDLDYDETPSDSAWCDYVKQRVGAAFPFQLVTGNHEEGSATNPGPDGYIGNHAACLPDHFGSRALIPGTPAYPANYYFDYPQSNPLMRVIMISANLKYAGIRYDFNTSEQANYNALAASIDQAKLAGMWVVVGVHKVCLTVGEKSCEIGADLMNLLIQKKVDLVLQGHDHSYQRSKQIALGSSCPSVAPGSYNAGCIADDGSDNTYTRGAGTVFVINGVVGRCCYSIRANDSEARYFAKTVGVDGNNTNGFVKYTVSRLRIDAQVINSVGTWGDSFSLVGSDPLPAPPTPIEPGASTTTNPPTFVWSPVTGAVGYEIQYGDTNPPGITAATAATGYTPPAPLLIKRYFWRVRAQLNDGRSTNWSPTRGVSIESVADAAPTRHHFVVRSPTITWNQITWAVEYEIQVATAATFDLPLSFAAIVLENIAELTINGLADGLYFWRVRARDPSGQWGDWSDVESFVLDVP